MPHINAPKFDRELKKGVAELLVLSLLESRPRLDYEVRKLIETRSDSVLKFNAASLLYQLEVRGWIVGRWVETVGQRRRRYYKLTRQGKKVLAAQSTIWQSLVEAAKGGGWGSNMNLRFFLRNNGLFNICSSFKFEKRRGR